MRKLLLASLAMASTAGIAAAANVTYTLPLENTSLREGPNRDSFVANCTGCHSVDYIATQPRASRLPKEFWPAEVNKMIHTYGAPISDEDVPKIIDYLTHAYGASE
jgi:cytochrome c553